MKRIWFLFGLAAMMDSSQCNPLNETGLELNEASKNIDILKTFDRFHHIRHDDEFFKHNVENKLNDEYLIQLYKFEMTETMKTDMLSHIIYFENIGWYSTSLTELFSVLYTKFIASNYAIKFKNCSFFYKYFANENETTSESCTKISEYLSSFVQLGIDDIIARTQQILELMVRPESEENWLKYQRLFEIIRTYFATITYKLPNEVPKDKLEFFKKFWETNNLHVTTKLEMKFFFRNLFFGTAFKYEDMRKEYENQKNYIKENIETIYNETVRFWGIADALVKKMEEHNPRTPKTNSDVTGIGETITSNATEILRDLEFEKLSKKEESKILHIIIESTSKFGEQIRFIPIQQNELMTPMNTSNYFKTMEIINKVGTSKTEPQKVQNDDKSAPHEQISPDSVFESAAANEDFSDASYITTFDTSAFSQDISDTSRPLISANDLRLQNKKSKHQARIKDSDQSNGANISDVDNISQQTEYTSAAGEENNNSSGVRYLKSNMSNENRAKLGAHILRHIITSASNESSAQSMSKNKHQNNTSSIHFKNPYPPILEVAS